jgi:hypothetical protein
MWAGPGSLWLPRTQIRAYRWCSPPRIDCAIMSPNRSTGLYLVGKADVGRRHVSDRQHGGQSWTSSHRHHEETGEFRSIQVFDFVKHAPDHDTVLKRYETSLNAMATTRRPYTR